MTATATWSRPGDVDDLVAKIGMALDARDRWPAWGEESVRIVRTTFDWPVVARRTLAEYERMYAKAGSLSRRWRCGIKT